MNNLKVFNTESLGRKKWSQGSFRLFKSKKLGNLLSAPLLIFIGLVTTACGPGLTNEELRGHYMVESGFLSGGQNNTGGINNNNNTTGGFGQRELVSFGSNQYAIYTGGTMMAQSGGSYTIIDNDRLSLQSQFMGGFQSPAQDLILSDSEFQNFGDQDLRVWRFNDDSITLREMTFEDFRLLVGGGQFGGTGSGQFDNGQLQNWYSNPDIFIQNLLNGFNNNLGNQQ